MSGSDVTALSTLTLLTTLATLGMAILPDAAEAQAPPSMGFEVGEPFPTLAFPALEDGEPRSISDFRGRKLIVHVFASW